RGLAQLIDFVAARLRARELRFETVEEFLEGRVGGFKLRLQLRHASPLVGRQLLLRGQLAALATDGSDAVGDFTVAPFERGLFGRESGARGERRSLAAVAPYELQVLVALEHVEHLLSFGESSLRDEQPGQRSVSLLLRADERLLRFLVESANVLSKLLQGVDGLLA